MTVTEILDRQEWERLKPLWNALLADSDAATTFLTWEWLSAWWEAYGVDADLRILTATDESGTIRGIAPLRRETVRRYGRRFTSLAFIGDGSNDSDYLDFVIARGFEEQTVNAWLRHLNGELSRGLILRLNEVSSRSSNLQVLKRLAADQLLVEEPVACATVHLPEEWNDYLSSLRPRFRTKVRSVLRNIEQRKDVRFAFCQNAADLERLLPALFELHTRRWNHDGRPGVFGWERKRTFYHELSPSLLNNGDLRFSWLEWNGRILACQYGFVHGTAYLHLQEGYEPASEHWNVGIALRAWSIREMQRAGIREYDFLAGIGRHKTDWGAEVKHSQRVVLAARTYRNMLFCRGPEWQQRTKDAIRAVLPARILAARARQETAGASGARATSPGEAADGWLRRAAAQCYFHLGGPVATRVLRARYQANTSPNRQVPHRLWMKRREPAGRILYYHRVNDDNDPFHPSIPIAVFDRHMRHVARSYKVVSLAAMLDHLASGSGESVVSVTFDDGYRDNYDNAFPILQRYGLPATIFLTTGSLDTGEPLWFEVLADALRRTSREFIDVEHELPRRFWLRTDAERLAANGELFGLLRQMPDRERKSLLPLILRDLSSAVQPPGEIMLTWDQVRAMHRRGIEFGGHTVTHPYLSRLTRTEVDWEISECKRRIEEELQSPVTQFAYPNGREDDFAPWNKDVLRHAGYQAAVTTMWGMNFSTTDRLELKRGGAWEHDEAMFAYKMDWYQLVNG